MARFLRQYFHCPDSRAGVLTSHPLRFLVHVEEVRNVLHVDLLRLEQCEAVAFGGLVEGGYKHVPVLI